MSLNLSTLTSSATSGDVLAEALTTADFLEPTPVLRNLSRGSNKGGDAKQDVALNQPKALPYDGKGYLYLSGVSGNYADVPVFDMGALDDFTIQIDGLDAGSVRPAATVTPISYFGSANVNRSFILQISTTGQIKLYLYLNGVTGHTYNDSTAVPTNTIGIKVTRVGTVLTYWVDTGSGYVSHDTDTVPTTPLYNPASLVSVNVGQYSGGDRLIGKIGRVVIWNNGTQAGDPVLDVDFTATNIRHGDTKFKCATGQVVTINQSGNDPATVIKKSVLRFDGVNDFMDGLLNQTITDGYMFAAFSVLGDGGESTSRIFSVNNTGGSDGDSQSAIFSLRNNSVPNDLYSYSGQWFSGHSQMFDNDNGDLLHESLIKNGTQKSLVNNAGLTNSTNATTISSEEFNIVSNATGLSNAAIDLEFLALFPASITDDQADSVRNYINNRNNVFDLKDGFGYYFFDAQKAAAGPITTGSASWNGRIVGSDFGDSDRYLTQGTSNDAPVGDGYVVTFADNSDHLEIPQVTQAGWQVVGTSLGTFAYRVNANAVTELNLLGNANTGANPYRQTGNLYGVILLPESATGADIEQARSLLIDRGAADGVTASSVENYFRERDDMVEFKGVSFSGVTNFTAMFFGSASLTTFNVNSLPNAVYFAYAFRGSGLTSFHTQLPLVTNASNSFYGSNLESFGVQLPEATRVEYAFYNCSSLSDFTTTDIKKCVNFTSAWHNCSSLSSFPSGAKLGTSANNVNFTSAFQSSGLTSFPALDFSNGKNFVSTFASCSNLTSLEAGVLFSANADNIVFYLAFSNCTSLVDFPPAAFDSLGTPAASCFLDCWSGCAALSANSVENILVSINTSGKSAPSTNPQITIDYNVATGSLSAATNTAVTSLKAKGWSIIVNNVTL